MISAHTIESMRDQTLAHLDRAVEAAERAKFYAVIACLRAGIEPPRRFIEAEPRTLEILATLSPSRRTK